MIIRSSFRGPGGLASHLLRTDHNEKVVVRPDLSPDLADEIGSTLRDYVAMAGAFGVEKSLLHLVMSPTRPLSRLEEARAITLIREAYGVGAAHPMLVVQHTKPGETDRAEHYHLVLPTVDPEGTRNRRGRPKRISDSFSRLRNQRLSIEIAHDLGHILVPGPHIDRVRARLAVERPDIQEALKETAPLARDGVRTSVRDKAESFDGHLDLAAFDTRVLSAFKADDFTSAGLLLAQGTKTIMVVDTATGVSQSLIRVVRRAAKREGRPITITMADLIRHVGRPQRTLKDAKRAGFDQELSKSVRQINAELDAAAFDAKSDGDQAALDGIQQVRAAEQARQGEHAARARATFAADRQEVGRRKTVAGRLRVQRARRAFHHGRIWFRLRTPIGYAAGVAALVAGAGIPAVIIAVIVAREVSMALEDASRSEGRRLIEGRTEATAAKAEYDDLFERVRAVRTFDFKSVPRQCRTAVGAIYRAASEGTAMDPEVLRALDEAVPGLSVQVSDVARYGLSVRVGDIFRNMFDPDNPSHRRALAAFVAKPLTPTVKVRVKSRGRGIGD